MPCGLISFFSMLGESPKIFLMPVNVGEGMRGSSLFEDFVQFQSFVREVCRCLGDLQVVILRLVG